MIGRSVYTLVAGTHGGKWVDLVQRRDATTLAVVAQRSITVSARRNARPLQSPWLYLVIAMGTARNPCGGVLVHDHTEDDRTQ